MTNQIGGPFTSLPTSSQEKSIPNDGNNQSKDRIIKSSSKEIFQNIDQTSKGIQTSILNKHATIKVNTESNQGSTSLKVFLQIVQQQKFKKTDQTVVKQLLTLLNLETLNLKSEEQRLELIKALAAINTSDLLKFTGKITTDLDLSDEDKKDLLNLIAMAQVYQKHPSTI